MATLRTNLTNSTSSSDTHPDHHNDLAAVLNKITTRATATYTTGVLTASGGQEMGLVTLSKGYRLYKVTTDRPARVRLYNYADYRDLDATRPIGTDYPRRFDGGLHFELVTTANALTWYTNPVVDGFSDTAQIPITVDNLQDQDATVTVEFTYLPTEV